MKEPSVAELFPKRASRRPLRALIVEDCDVDEELMLRELLRADFEPDWVRVDSEAEYLAHLSNDFDVILADQKLPDFSAPRALELLRARGLEVPFIIVSGTINEEQAVAAMRQGAADYLMKDRLARLGSAVDHAMEQRRLNRERKEAEEALHSTHARMRQLLEHSPAIIYSLRVESDEFIPHLASQSVTTLLGFSVQETLHRGWWHQQVHPDDRERARASLAETLSHGSNTFEYRMYHKDGSVRWVEDQQRLVRDASERPTEIIGIWTDITDRKKAEEMLSSAFVRERQARKTANLREIMGALTASGILFGLAVWLKFFSGPLDKFPGLLVVLMIAVVPALTMFGCRRWFGIRSETGEEQRTTRALRSLLVGLDKRMQQSTADLARTNEALRLKIAEHRRDGDILRESERRFRDMLQNVELIAITLDKDGTVTFCNDYLLKVTGWQREEVIGGNWFEQFTPDNLELKKLFREHAGEGTFPAHYENAIRTKSGEVRDIVWNNTLLRGSSGNIVGTASIGQDVTERTQATQALRTSEQRFRSFMQHSPIAGWITDAKGRFCYVSPGYYRMFQVGVDDLTGKLISEIYDTDLAANYIANNDIVFREQRVVETVEPGLRADGTAGEFMAVKFPMTGPDGTPLLGGIALDITERKQLEQQFLRAQRMESIGTLAGGIAHDLNNSLGPILMALDVLKMKFPDPDSQEILALISSSAQRGADMVKQVLSFGRGMEGRKVEVQVKHLLREIEKIANDTFLKNIAVNTSFPNDLRIVSGDPTQLHQVLLNLCLNARDAMPQGGTLSLSAENVVLDSHYVALNPEAKPGPYVHIVVEDTGSGIPPEIIEKIFDPFFTTKEVGRGTGLGLYSSLGIVKNHGGFIRVSSEMGQGTKFEIFLPAQTAPDGEAVPPEATLPRGNGETVLVVDDEAIVREITRQTLETFGYRVLLATDGADGIGKIAAPDSQIAVVVTDIAMPVMDGAAMIQVLRRFDSKMPIIVTSGQATREQLAQIGDLEEKHVLTKPFTAEDLLHKLKEAIGSRS